MKRFITLLFALIATFSASSQNYIQDGDLCFDNGDYTCAIANYDKAFKNLSGKDRQIAEIKLTRANWCAEHIKTANLAFSSKNYIIAKDEYQKVLDSNPKDSYAQSQILKCNNTLNPPATTLSVSKENLSFPSIGGNESIKVTTNASLYSVIMLPFWCSVQKYADYFSITCIANSGSTNRTDFFKVVAGDKSVRVNVSQSGKTNIQETTLSVSSEHLSFPSSGGKSESVMVNTNSSSYAISLVPSWCSVQKQDRYFIVTCYANNSALSRSDWLKVTSANKEIKVFINQLGAAYNSQSNNSKNKKCFNCPKGRRHPIGFSLGYVNKPLIDYVNGNNKLGLIGGFLGFRIEPLFKYGFGLNTGIYLEYFPEMYKNGNSKTVVNLPLSLEYRFNFHKSFSMFFNGGASVDYTINAFTDLNLSGNSEPLYYIGYLDKNRFVPYLEYGGGLRIKKVQFNVGIHYFVDTQDSFEVNIKEAFNFNKQMNYSISCSIMF